VPALCRRIRLETELSTLDTDYLVIGSGAVRPSMFHFATTSTGEIESLRRITQVIRQGRVRAIDAQGLTLAQGRFEMPALDTLYIDCTASRR
jgi:hypothetical protein